VIKSQTSKTSNITKVTISRLKNNGGLVMDNGTLVQINTKTEQATNRVSKVWSDDLKMKALEDKLIQAPHKKDDIRYCRKKLRLLF
jgi:small-conductance mechanosensitive channel